MPIPTAPALLIGLGARILLNTVNSSPDTVPSTADSILLGAWQGVGLQYTSRQPALSIPVIAAILIKLLYDYSTSPDPARALTNIIGILLGVVGSELLSSYLDSSFAPSDEDELDLEPEPRRRTRSLPSRYLPPVPTHHLPKPSRERTVQFRASVQGGSIETPSIRPPNTLVASDITSVSSSAFELLSNPNPSPQEREIASLRARASLADSERRRYKEERKWALAQGNVARAEQMKGEYRRYKALMESCHREADLKLLAMEAAKERAERGFYTDDRFDLPGPSRGQSRSPPPPPPPSRDPKPSKSRITQPREGLPMSNRSASANHASATTTPSRSRAAPQPRKPSNSHAAPSYQEYKDAQQLRRVSGRRSSKERHRDRDPYT